jgi:hypothetical protein
MNYKMLSVGTSCAAAVFAVLFFVERGHKPALPSKICGCDVVPSVHKPADAGKSVHKQADTDKVEGALKAELEEWRNKCLKLESKVAKLESAARNAAENQKLGEDAHAVNSGDGAVLPSLNMSQQNEKIRKLFKQMGSTKTLSVEERYADLLDQFNLSEEDRDEFVRLLKNGNGLVAGMSKANDSKIRDLLGDEAFSDYDKYRKSIPMRDFVNGFDDYLAENNMSISDEQRDRLIALDPALLSENAMDGGTFSLNIGNGRKDLGDAINDQLDDSISSYDKIVEEAGKTLNAEQNKALDAYLGKRFEQKEAQAKLAAEILPQLGIMNDISNIGDGSMKIKIAPMQNK